MINKLLKVHPVCLLLSESFLCDIIKFYKNANCISDKWTSSLFCYTPFNCETYQSYLKTLNFWHREGRISVDGQKSLKASVGNKS